MQPQSVSGDSLRSLGLDLSPAQHEASCQQKSSPECCWLHTKEPKVPHNGLPPLQQWSSESTAALSEAAPGRSMGLLFARIKRASSRLYAVRRFKQSPLQVSQEAAAVLPLNFWEELRSMRGHLLCPENACGKTLACVSLPHSCACVFELPRPWRKNLQIAARAPEYAACLLLACSTARTCHNAWVSG